MYAHISLYVCICIYVYIYAYTYVCIDSHMLFCIHVQEVADMNIAQAVSSGIAPLIGKLVKDRMTKCYKFMNTRGIYQWVGMPNEDLYAIVYHLSIQLT